MASMSSDTSAAGSAHSTSSSSSSSSANPFSLSAWEGFHSSLSAEKRLAWFKTLDASFEHFAWSLKRHELNDTRECAILTADLLKKISARIPPNLGITVLDLLDILKAVGRILTEARPMELVIGNIVRRALFIVRHECAVYQRRNPKAPGTDWSSQENSSGAAGAAGADGLSSSSAQQHQQQGLGAPTLERSISSGSGGGGTPGASSSSKEEKDEDNVDMSLSLHRLLEGSSSSSGGGGSGGAGGGGSGGGSSAAGGAGGGGAGGGGGGGGSSDGSSAGDGGNGDDGEVSFSRGGLDLSMPVDRIRSLVLTELGILLQEIVNGDGTIAEQAISHVYAKEVILTIGYSPTVVSFLCSAARLRYIEVFVAESAPSFSGHKMALALATEANRMPEGKENGLTATVITDSAVFAVMSSVNKVIIGTHVVLANGGLVAPTGVANVCWAAKHHSVPVVVLTSMHQVCPLYAFDQQTFNEQNAPSQILPFDVGSMGNGDVDIENPAFDYVPAELVTQFLTNYGGHPPSYIYRLLSDFYNSQDYSLL